MGFFPHYGEAWTTHIHVPPPFDFPQLEYLLTFIQLVGILKNAIKVIFDPINSGYGRTTIPPVYYFGALAALGGFSAYLLFTLKKCVRLLSPNVGDSHHHAHDECDSIGNTRIQFSEFSGVTERKVELTFGEMVMRCMNLISPIQLRHEYDDTGRQKKRPMLKFIELESFPKNWDGIIKCKYSETTSWDLICAMIKQRNPKYGKWVMAHADVGEKPYTKEELRMHAREAKQVRA